MSLLAALFLGVLQAATEFLPVSSTGHLLLAAHAMGLSGDTMNAFEVVIQLGALIGRLGAPIAGGPRPGGRSDGLAAVHD